MSIAREELRWNGWGRMGEAASFSSARERALLDALASRLGRELQPTPPPVELDEVRLPPSKLDPASLAALRAACGEQGVRTSPFERVTHALGKSLPDLLRLRRGDVEAVPEAVVYPADEGAVAAVLRLARSARLAVVPFGGGTSVVGGVDARTGEGQGGALCLDTTRLDQLLRVDAESGTATVQAGIDGPALEAALAGHGFTLGHFPQSFEHSTVGGWVATRSAGQQSDGYGAIDELLVAVRVVTPEGVIRTLAVPHAATGPDLKQVVLGSEGTLGVIVEATLRVRPSPAAHDDRGMLFRSFSDGVAAIREIAQSELPIGMLRLADADETELSLLLRHDPERRFDPTALALAAAARRGYGKGRCVLIYGAEGASARGVRAVLARARAAGRRHGGLPLGRGPGRSWRRERFRTPYLRDWLLDRGVAVDTVETSLSWSRLQAGHQAILRALRGALQRHAGAGLAMAHLSHSHHDGACLYFTVLYPLDRERELEQWGEFKATASEAILDAGGTLSHHHGVGIDNRPWLPREKGELALAALRGLKHVVDPDGVMNPEKLL